MASDISPDSLFRDAQQLSDDQRATLAALLLESLEEVADDDVEAACRQELHKRANEVISGTVKMLPWEQTRGKLGLADE